jgi:hypothetical protein
MCDRFHKLPDEILDHDYVSLMRVWDMLTHIDQINAKRGKQQSL